MKKSAEIKPIGYVRNEIKDPYFRNWKKIVSEIIIKEKYKKALDCLEDYSHILVICWLHKASKVVNKIHPRERKDLPLVGLFATRTPNRPNPIAISAVKLLERKENKITVLGLDMINETPVIDIKPYIPQIDSIKNSKVPNWINKIHKNLTKI